MPLLEEKTKDSLSATGTKGRICPHYLSEEERGAFIAGFAEAAREVWPDYDEDMDSLSTRPFCRPWDTDPCVIVYDGRDRPAPEALGRAYFTAVRMDMERGPFMALRHGGHGKKRSTRTFRPAKAKRDDERNRRTRNGSAMVLGELP